MRLFSFFSQTKSRNIPSGWGLLLQEDCYTIKKTHNGSREPQRQASPVRGEKHE